MTADDLAYAMFTRRVHLDDGDQALIEHAWQDTGIRAFWTAEATHILALIKAADPLGPTREKKGGYESSSRLVTELNPPPRPTSAAAEGTVPYCTGATPCRAPQHLPDCYSQAGSHE